MTTMARTRTTLDEALAVLDPLVARVEALPGLTVDWERIARDARAVRALQERGHTWSATARAHFGEDGPEHGQRELAAVMGMPEPQFAPRVRLVDVLALAGGLDAQARTLDALEVVGEALGELEDREADAGGALLTAISRRAEAGHEPGQAWRGAVGRRVAACEAVEAAARYVGA